MRIGRTALAGLCLSLAVAATAAAQFGHPLKGSWSGEWGPAGQPRTRVLINIGWDGKTLSAVLNPGPNQVPLKTTLDPETWTVKFEGEGRDRSGAPVKYVIEGKIENLGAYQRFITGTWTEGSAKGDFKLVRN